MRHSLVTTVTIVTVVGHCLSVHIIHLTYSPVSMYTVTEADRTLLGAHV